MRGANRHLDRLPIGVSQEADCRIKRDLCREIKAVGEALFLHTDEEVRSYLYVALVKMIEEFHYPRLDERSQYGRLEENFRLNDRMVRIQFSRTPVVWEAYDFGPVLGITYVWPLKEAAARKYLDPAGNYDWDDMSLADIEPYEENPEPFALYIGDILALPAEAAVAENYHCPLGKNTLSLAAIRMESYLQQHILDSMPPCQIKFVSKAKASIRPVSRSKRLPILLADVIPEDPGGRLFKRFGFQYLERPDGSVATDKTGWYKGCFDLNTATIPRKAVSALKLFQKALWHEEQYGEWKL